MIAAIRAHANLIEFAPLCLLLIYMASDFYGFWVTAGLSVVLLLARVLHAGGMLGGLLPHGIGVLAGGISLKSKTADVVLENFRPGTLGSWGDTVLWHDFRPARLGPDSIAPRQSLTPALPHVECYWTSSRRYFLRRITPGGSRLEFLSDERRACASR